MQQSMINRRARVKRSGTFPQAVGVTGTIAAERISGQFDQSLVDRPRFVDLPPPDTTVFTLIADDPADSDRIREAWFTLGDLELLDWPAAVAMAMLQRHAERWRFLFTDNVSWRPGAAPGGETWRRLLSRGPSTSDTASGGPSTAWAG